MIYAGIIYWQVNEGKLDEAEQQIEFLTEIQSSIGKNTVSYITSPSVLTTVNLYTQYNTILTPSTGLALCQCITGTEEEKGNQRNW